MMKKIAILLNIMLLAGLLSYGQQHQMETGKLVITYENLQSSEGNVMLKLYDKNSPKFPDAKSAIAIKTVKIENKQATVIFDSLPYGVYAFTTFHDENENGKMDTNRIYFPTEGYAFSNNLHIVFGPPSFSKASFKLSESVKTIEVKLNY